MLKKICSKCKNEVSKTMKFCPNCANPILNNVEKKIKTTWKVLFILVCLVLISALFYGLLYVYPEYKKATIVMDNIDAIGIVDTLNIEKKIMDAEKSYDELSRISRSFVKNHQELINARDSFESLPSSFASKP